MYFSNMESMSFTRTEYYYACLLPWYKAYHVELLYAAMCLVTGSLPVLVIVWGWLIGLVLLCGRSGALEYPTKSFMYND